MYLQFLMVEFPQLAQDLENFVFHQDGAPPHNLRAVTENLNQVFPERWMGLHGFFPWPARSPDLTPLDFFFGGEQ